MDAWLLTESPGEYAWGSLADPEPGPTQVRIRVVASALNHMDHWLTIGRPRPRSFPHVPGADVAGIVDRVGSEVSEWEQGDEVVVNPALVPSEALAMGVDSVLHPSMAILGEHIGGGHGEFCVVEAHQLVRRPAGRTWEDSAAYPIAMSTAWRLLRRADIQPGEVVLVTGIGGGVATAAMTLALHLGAEVTVTSRSPAKRERAIELGAAASFDSNGPYPFTTDIVVDSIGPATWEAAMGTLRRGGRMCVCGGTSGQVAELDLPRLFFRQLDIIGASCASQQEFSDLTDVMGDGLAVVVDDVVPLAEYPSALDRLRSGGQIGKIVLRHPE